VIQTYFKHLEINLMQNKILIDEVDENEREEVIQNYHLVKTNHRGLE
jgi:hypothetical protein